MATEGTRTRILFVRQGWSPFSQGDITLLSKHFDVKVLDFYVSGLTFSDIARSMRNLLFGFFWADVTLSWFTGWHSMVAVLVSKILRKKSIVIAGGSQVASIPLPGYRVHKSLATAIKYSLLNADSILSVSEFNRMEIQRIVKSRHVKLIYNGVDTDKFSPGLSAESETLSIPSALQHRQHEGQRREIEKEDIVLTVAVINHTTIRNKGLDTFVKSAHLLPHVRFMIVGACNDGSIEELMSIAPRNVEFMGFHPEQSLIPLYRRAKVYCQLSLYESFGVALAEAMSCGCVPVVTRNGALPEVVGDTGFYVPFGDPVSTARAIETAMGSGRNDNARSRILANFPIQRREMDLVREIESLAIAERH